MMNQSNETTLGEVMEQGAKVLAEMEVKNKLKSDIYNDLNNCHDIPKPIIRSVFAESFETCYLVHGNTPELDKALLVLCQEHYDKVMEKL